MGGCQNLRTNLKFTSKREWLSDPVMKLFGNLSKHSIPKLQRRSLKGKRNAKKVKSFPMSDPFPLILANTRRSW